jgi:mRNA-degrading endonuclease RelE of RelBE toxin-antitoxin system
VAKEREPLPALNTKHIAMARQAVRDLRSLTHSQGLDRVEAALVGLEANPTPDNLDIKALKGQRPWLRARAGDWRIIFRPLTRAELLRWREYEQQTQGYLVARIVHRRDLERTVRTLEL